MAAKVLQDVINNFISIDSLLDWLSNRKYAKDVNVFLEKYKCNQVEFASYFLNFLREQTSMIPDSSCSIESSCKTSQLRKIKSSACSPDASANESPSTCSTGKKLDLKSLDSFPALSDVSNKSKSNEKLVKRIIDSAGRECIPTSAKESPREFRRVELFPDRRDSPDRRVGEGSLRNTSDSHTSAIVSTPKSTGSANIADYFSRVMNLEESPTEWSPGSRERSDKFRQTCNGSVSAHKLKSQSGSFGTTNRSKEWKSGSKILLRDFIGNDVTLCGSKREKKSKVRKRINPTPVTSASPRFDENSSFDVFETSSVQNGPSADERQVLRLECANIEELLEGNSITNSRHKDTASVRLFTTPTKEIDIKSVSFMDELKMLSRIYSTILDENYCQNIMVEFCFVISLLVIQDHGISSQESDSDVAEAGTQLLLNTVHNCVYFAVETLWLQRHLLLLLNLAALKLLSENRQIEKFNSELKDFLSKACIEKQAKEMIKRQAFDGKATRQGNVSFEYENDNKDNFSSQMNFHSFRKQRDLFYNILATWEENHLTGDWVFSAKLGSRIQSLLALCPDPTNLLHLARLFRSQLVMSCCGDYQSEGDTDEEILQLFASVDRNKIQRLRARLRSTPKRQGPCPTPDFMGHQEFFKDFILSTSYTIFHHYLKSSFCDEILRLNDVELGSDVEDDDSCLDQQTQSQYYQLINVLCLLAKFLGFIEFLPYRADKQWPDRVLNLHCSVRQNLLPLFDLESCIRTSFTRHKLTVTIPWIVNYLSMIDFCSARLKVYRNVWTILVVVYFQLKTCKNLMTSFYLRLVLGWIFQLPNFPSELFYAVLQDVGKTISTLCLPALSSIEFTTGLDSYNFIEENILYSVCPYLSEINAILTESAGCNVRHIRPVTQGSTSPSSQTQKQLQMRLEESFLHNQSSSTRRTVEFVTERVSSVVVKYLIHNIIPVVKQKALKKLSELESSAEDANEKLCAISEDCYKDLIATCEIESWHLCSVRSEKALSALLGVDLDGAVSQTCTQIVTRQSAEKVLRWIQTHVTLAIITKEFTTVMGKNQTPRNPTRTCPASDVSIDNLVPASFIPVRRDSPPPLAHPAPSDVIVALREIALRLLEKGIVKWEELDAVLRSGVQVLSHSIDESYATEVTLRGLTIDLMILLCLIHDTELKRDNLRPFFRLLRECNETKCPGNPLERLICPRNVALLFWKSKNPERAWENLGDVFKFLMDEGLLTPEQVEAQLVTLLRRDWNVTESKSLMKLVSRILTGYLDTNGYDKFSLLLEYLAETLSDERGPCDLNTTR